MAIYGYAHVSSADQDYALQEQALRAAGCEIMRAEKASGTVRAGRTERALPLPKSHANSAATHAERNSLPYEQSENISRLRLNIRTLPMDIQRSGSQPSTPGPTEYFTGTICIDPLFQALEPAHAFSVSVTFEPCARTAWHPHPRWVRP
jgi:hypothetical protein